MFQISDLGLRQQVLIRGFILAIQKVSATDLRKVGLHYTTITNEVMALIKNPESLAIWVYLLSQDDKWIVRKKDLKNRFGLGEGRYKKAMDELKSLGLVDVVIVRDGGGKIESKTTICASLPIDWIVDSTMIPETDHDGGKTILWEKPYYGKSAPLIKNQVINKVSNSNKGYKSFADRQREQAEEALREIESREDD